MNDRAYRNGRDLGGGVYETDEPEDPICPTCRKVTSVSRQGALWWCDDCDLAFNGEDAERVDPKWAAQYRERREQGHQEPLPVQRYRRPERLAPISERVKTEESK